MIHDPMDLAEVLAAAVRPGTDGEAEPTEPRRAALVTPPRAVFLVRTVEGRTFRVTVDEEWT